MDYTHNYFYTNGNTEKKNTSSEFESKITGRPLSS